MYRRLAFIAATVLAVAAPALAQESALSFKMGGGVMVPSSGLGNAFGPGENFQVGIDVTAMPMVRFQVQYDYIELGSRDLSRTTELPPGVSSTIPLTANHTGHGAEFNLVFGRPLNDKRARLYGIAGVGAYHETVNLATSAVGTGIVCNPWLLICDPNATPVTQIIGDRSKNLFGINVGGGMEFRFGDSAKFFVEVRYIHAYGPTFTDPSGGSRTANFDYVPITFGFRIHTSN